MTGVRYRCVISCTRCGRVFRQSALFNDPLVAYRATRVGIEETTNARVVGSGFYCGTGCSDASWAREAEK